MREPTTASRTLAALALPTGAALALALATALTAHALSLSKDLTPASSVDSYVVLAVTTLGALLAVWFGLHLLLGAACALGAATGRRWRAGERVLAAHGPALVRRGVAAAVGVSLGIGGVAGATATSHAPAPDLGWVPVSELEVTPVTDGEPSDEDSSAPKPDSEEAADGPAPAAPAPGAPAPKDAEPTTPAPSDPVPNDQAPNDAPPLDPAPAPDTSATDEHAPLPHGPAEHVDDAEPGPVHGEAPSNADDADDEPAAAARTVVVAAGDSLWSITQDLLDGASDTEIARAWPQLYEANRDLVGADPHLIHPGHELVVPTILEEQS